MSRKASRNAKPKETVKLIERFKEMIDAAYKHLNCLTADELWGMLSKEGYPVKREYFSSQFSGKSIPTEGFVNALAKHLNKLGVGVDAKYVISPDKKAHKSVLLPNFKQKDEVKDPEIVIEEDGEVFDLGGDAPVLDINEDESETINLGGEPAETPIEEVPKSDASAEDEDIVKPKVIEDILLDDLIETGDDVADIPEPTPQSNEVPDNGYERVNKLVEDKTGIVPEVLGERGLTAREKWIAEAKEAGITEINENGMSAIKDGKSYLFIHDIAKNAYSVCVQDITTFPPKVVKAYKFADDILEWKVFVAVDFSCVVPIRATSKAEAEAKVKDLKIVATCNGKEMDLCYANGVAQLGKKK